MKREEMILLIAECLVEPHFDDAINEANYILTKIEKAGMVPPPRIEKDPGHFFGDAFEYEVNEWEDEA